MFSKRTKFGMSPIQTCVVYLFSDSLYAQSKGVNIASGFTSKSIIDFYLLYKIWLVWSYSRAVWMFYSMRDFSFSEFRRMSEVN